MINLRRHAPLRCTKPAAAAICLLIALTTGCVRETADGGEEVFQYQLWAPLALAVAGIAAAPIGWFLRERSTRFGWGLLVLGPIFALALAPSLYLERVTVGGDGFHVRSGIWGSTAVFDVDFNQLRSLRFITQTRTTRRGRRTEEVMVCGLTTGGETRIALNNDVKRAAVKAIVQQAAARGIQVVDET
ncbi:MAG TPA: hypothetical protein VJ783_05575 [Pirellulales bacterium]|nr:hypothetical protein [Pirellulales bacterium]